MSEAELNCLNHWTISTLRPSCHGSGAGSFCRCYFEEGQVPPNFQNDSERPCVKHGDKAFDSCVWG